ncbi:hypothetical protein OH77DRAFT_1426502 [Trametes cingulata]|nr:hypothetical protein OH77DRAFT_1426502 [Trametes cingulata]
MSVLLSLDACPASAHQAGHDVVFFSAVIKVNRDELPPKPVTGAYMFFTRSAYAELPKDATLGQGESITKYSAQIAERWKSMSEEEKKPYQEQYEKAREEYRRAAVEWYKNTDPRIVRALKAQGHRLPEPVPDEFKRPATAYLRFCMANQDKVKVPEGLPQKEVIAILGKQMAELWRQAPQEEKDRLAAEYAKDLEAYQKRMQGPQA